MVVIKTKKTIGISFSRTNFQNYWNWFAEETGEDMLELVELSFEKNNVEDFVRCDGFVLSGGVDIWPERYGGPECYENMELEFQPERDQFEEKIFLYALKNNRPLLAICRGLQLVNVIEGGSLIQDLGVGNEIHRKLTTDKEHSINIYPGTLLHDIVGVNSGIVNSAHHQAIDMELVGNHLMVNACTSDGVAEGIEFCDRAGKAFMLGVQWHPERMKDKNDNPLSWKIKKSFLDAVHQQQ